MQRYDSFLREEGWEEESKFRQCAKNFSRYALFSRLFGRDFIRKIYPIGMEKVFLFEELIESNFKQIYDELFWIISNEYISFARK